jgi:hypothetical protein
MANEPRAAMPSFTWRDNRRFIEVSPVQTGWLVMWGSLQDGDRTVLGNRIYRDLNGVRRRVAAAAMELTVDLSTAQVVIERFDRVLLPVPR